MTAPRLIAVATLVASLACGAHSSPKGGVLTGSVPGTVGDTAMPTLALWDPESELDLAVNGRIDPAEGVRRLLAVPPRRGRGTQRETPDLPTSGYSRGFSFDFVAL